MSTQGTVRFNSSMETVITGAPAQARTPGKPTRAGRRSGAAAPHETGRRAPTIFIVDDDEAVRGALRMLVMSFGWSASAYESGQAFFHALRRVTPDCILLDLDMPGMNGAEVQESLRAQGIEIPVIIITGQKNPQLLARARAAGALGMLSKPFQDEELKRLIEHAIRLAD